MSSTPPDSGFGSPERQRLDADVQRTLLRLRRAAVLLSLLIAVLLPTAQLGFALQALQGRLDVEAAQLADQLSMRATRQPDIWLYQVNLLQADLRAVQDRRTASALRLLDERADTVAQVGDWLPRGGLTASAEVLDSGALVATVQAQTSTAPALLAAAEMLLVSLLLAGMVWWLINRLAIDSVAKMVGQLQTMSDEAQAASRAKSAFLAAMSHEIRTPMNGVIGMAELLAHSPLDDEQKPTVRTIRESAQALLRIIDDILDFSKIEAGRLELENEPLRLTALCDSVCDALAPVAMAGGVQLLVWLAPDVPDAVRGDSGRLRQLLNNLLGNAVKFSAGLTGRRARVALRVRREGDDTVFEISDNGIGIGAEAQAKLFEPFMQAEASTTRRFGGTGLGLAITRRLVVLMGGRISLRSAPDQGATFAVSLPLQAMAEQPTPLLPQLRALPCLLLRSELLPVDDLRAWLEAAGAQVQVADSPGHAVDLARGIVDRPLVLVHDAANPLNLPESDVRELLLAPGPRGAARVISPTVTTLDQWRQGALLRAVAVAAGRASPEMPPETAGMLTVLPMLPVPASSGAPARLSKQLILVAEDDAINRAVITRQLALLGFAAEVAHDGAHALQMWRKGDYALLLSDLHMPELDGYALAAAIRADEAAQGRRSMPILALTANALKGEASHARAVGMNDYLTKPVPLRLLQATLQQWLPGTQALPSQAAPHHSDPAVFDIGVLRAQVGGDCETVRDLLGDLVLQLHRCGSALLTALATNSQPAAAAAAAAGQLGSVAASLGAGSLVALCAEIECSASASPSAFAASRAAGLPALRAALAAVTQAADQACREAVS